MSMTYDIDAGGATTTLSMVQTTASQLPGESQTVVAKLRSLLGQLAHSPMTAGAVAQYTEGPVTDDIKEIIGRTHRSLVGGQAALLAYEEGDAGMMSTALAAAAAAPTADDMPGVSGP